MATEQEWRAAIEHLYLCALEADSMKQVAPEHRKKIACIAAVEMLTDKFKEHGEVMPPHVGRVCKNFMTEIRSNDE